VRSLFIDLNVNIKIDVEWIKLFPTSRGKFCLNSANCLSAKALAVLSLDRMASSIDSIVSASVKKADWNELILQWSTGYSRSSSFFQLLRSSRWWDVRVMSKTSDKHLPSWHQNSMFKFQIEWITGFDCFDLNPYQIYWIQSNYTETAPKISDLRLFVVLHPDSEGEIAVYLCFLSEFFPHYSFSDPCVCSHVLTHLMDWDCRTLQQKLTSSAVSNFVLF
jgi:hypothetical protein